MERELHNFDGQKNGNPLKNQEAVKTITRAKSSTPRYKYFQKERSCRSRSAMDIWDSG